jgi:hypothetical protein
MEEERCARDAAGRTSDVVHGGGLGDVAASLTDHQAQLDCHTNHKRRRRDADGGELRLTFDAAGQ